MGDRKSAGCSAKKENHHGSTKFDWNGPKNMQIPTSEDTIIIPSFHIGEGVAEGYHIAGPVPYLTNE
jgi:hypothetical protein